MDHYTLTFHIESEFKEDEIYLASDFPYTYSTLMQKLRKWCSPRNNTKARSNILCKTLAGNYFPMIDITNFMSNEEEIAARPVIVFTARVHPG